MWNKEENLSLIQLQVRSAKNQRRSKQTANIDG